MDLAASSRPNVTPNELSSTLLDPAAVTYEEGLEEPLAIASGAVIWCSDVNQGACAVQILTQEG